jgi:CubicO group peptidase (beta-lactamase class C family)
MKALTFVLLFCIMIGYTPSLHAQQYVSSIDEKAIYTLMKDNRIPTLGIGIIKEGKVAFTKVYGELAPGEPAPQNTLFNVASLTKPVVTMLTLQLVNMGQWNLDEPLAKYWVDPDVKSDSNAYKLTTRHVLSHQTGFLNWRWLHATKKLVFDFEPGTQFQYSGEGFEYLRKALEKKFNQPLDKLCDSLIFKPLQMQDSHLTWDSIVEEGRFAKWHDKEGKNTYPTWKPQSPNAADDLITTVEDYSKFGVVVLNGFGLSPTLFKEMVTPKSAINKNSSMCLGWECFDGLAGSEYAILHTGSDIGVKALVLLFPHSKQGLVILTNSDNGNMVYEKLITNILGNLGNEFLKKAQ